MILHLFHDDKVCNRVVANFEEVFPNNNIYLCICDKDNLRFIRQDPRIIFLYPGDYLTDKSILSKVDKICIHYLEINKINFITNNIDYLRNARVYWPLWGGDLYNTILYSYGYDIYFDHRYLWFESLGFKIRNRVKSLFGLPRIEDINQEVLNFIINRVDYILSNQEEYDLAKRYLGAEFSCSLLEGPIYYPIEDTLGKLINKKVRGNNIFIGNSASFTNNHEYSIYYLSKLNTKGRKKILPLNYGGNPKYIKHIHKVAKNNWGDEYCPLTTFLPLNEYNELMLSANVYVYGNWRQEAVGNIVMALYLGAKVFVSEKSPLINIFAKYGIKLYKTEMITQEDIDTTESSSTIQRNRTAIYKMYSKESILNNIKTIFG